MLAQFFRIAGGVVLHLGIVARPRYALDANMPVRH
jgi:hypothetical protein